MDVHKLTGAPASCPSANLAHGDVRGCVAGADFSTSLSHVELYYDPSMIHGPLPRTGQNIPASHTL